MLVSVSGKLRDVSLWQRKNAFFFHRGQCFRKLEGVKSTAPSEHAKTNTCNTFGYNNISNISRAAAYLNHLFGPNFQLI